MRQCGQVGDDELSALCKWRSEHLMVWRTVTLCYLAAFVVLLFHCRSQLVWSPQRVAVLLCLSEMSNYLDTRRNVPVVGVCIAFSADFYLFILRVQLLDRFVGFAISRADLQLSGLFVFS
jgi:hypothetical protein